MILLKATIYVDIQCHSYNILTTNLELVGIILVKTELLVSSCVSRTLGANAFMLHK